MSEQPAAGVAAAGAAAAAAEEERKLPKRTVALHAAYVGTGFKGEQRLRSSSAPALFTCCWAAPR